MLKTVKTSLLLATATLALSSAPAQADISSALQNICTIVESDDKSELRKKMKKVQSDYRMKFKDYYSGITCAGNSLIRTAMLNNAEQTGALMVKKMPKKDLVAAESDGKTLQQWVQENGLQASPIAQALAARI